MEKVLMFGGQILKFMTTLEQQGATPASVQRVLESGILADLFNPSASVVDRRAVQAALGLRTHPQEFRLEVNYKLSFREMLIRSNIHDPNEPDLNLGNYRFGKDFFYRGTNGAGTLRFEARLMLFEHSCSYERGLEKIAGLDRINPWVPAGLDHLIAFATSYPEELSSGSVLALGSAHAWKPTEFDGQHYKTGYDFVSVNKSSTGTFLGHANPSNYGVDAQCQAGNYALIVRKWRRH